MKPNFFVWYVLLHLICATDVYGESSAFERHRVSFENFMTCELTRLTAPHPFDGKPFDIIMASVFDIRKESGIVIVTGAVTCDVQGEFKTLHVVAGLRTIMGKEHISFYVARPEHFTLLATQLMRFPYKDRCTWSRYRVPLN